MIGLAEFDDRHNAWQVLRAVVLMLENNQPCWFDLVKLSVGSTPPATLLAAVRRLPKRWTSASHLTRPCSGPQPALCA